MNRGHVIIRVPEFYIFRSKKKYWFDYRWEYWTFTMNCFLEHEWYLCSLIAVAYMSIVMFVHDDYTTCLKIINCITHVMIILGPCRNNNKFQSGTVNFFVCTCCACCDAHTCCVCFPIVVGKCKLTQFPQKWNNKSDWCWQRWLCNWVAQLVKLQSFQVMLVTGVRFIFNKFPPSNMQLVAFTPPHNHGIFFPWVR